MFAPQLLHEFPRHYEAIVRYLRRRLGCTEWAREVAHETWVHLSERQSGNTQAEASPVGDALSYFCTVAANLHLDQHRRAQWLRGYLAQDADTGAGATHMPDVADGLMYRQALAGLDTALAALPPRQRAVFEAHRIHGEREADIAARLGVSLGLGAVGLLGAGGAWWGWPVWSWTLRVACSCRCRRAACASSAAARCWRMRSPRARAWPCRPAPARPAPSTARPPRGAKAACTSTPCRWPTPCSACRAPARAGAGVPARARRGTRHRPVGGFGLSSTRLPGGSRAP